MTLIDTHSVSPVILRMEIFSDYDSRGFMAGAAQRWGERAEMEEILFGESA